MPECREEESPRWTRWKDDGKVTKPISYWDRHLALADLGPAK